MNVDTLAKSLTISAHVMHELVVCYIGEMSGFLKGVPVSLYKCNKKETK